MEHFQALVSCHFKLNHHHLSRNVVSRAKLQRKKMDLVSGLLLWGVVALLLLAVSSHVLWLLRSRAGASLWKNWHVLVTGGSEGLGLALAQLALARGARVSLVGRSQEKLAAARVSLSPLLRGNELRLQTFACDVSREGALEEAVRTLEKQSGPVDLAVANAGTALPRLFQEQSEAETRAMMDVNFFGAAALARAVLPSMRRAGSGKLVFVASSMALTAFAGFSGYCASKWAVRGFAECLRCELAPANLSVQVFFAPTMRTPGLAAENKEKPAVTAELEALGEALSASEAAAALARGIDGGRFEIAADAGGELLAAASLGSPYGNWAARAVLAPVLVGLTAAWRWHIDRVCRKHLK